MFDSRFPVAFGSPPATPSGSSPVAAISGAGAPTDGVTGVGFGQGTFYRDTTNGQWYTNTGSAAAPVWHLFIQA